MTAPRYGTAPVTLADGRMAYERNAARPLNPPNSGIEPMVEPTSWRVHWRKTVATTALLAVGAYAVGFALWGLG